MNGIETAQKGDLLTTTGKDVFELIEVTTKKIFIMKNLRTQDEAVFDEDDPDIGKLVKIEIRPQIAQMNTDNQKHKPLTGKKAIKQSASKKISASGKSAAQKAFIGAEPDDKNPYPGVSYNGKFSGRPWRGQFNRPPNYFSGQFATAEEARDAVEKKISELGLKPLRGMGKKKIERIASAAFKANEIQKQEIVERKAVGCPLFECIDCGQEYPCEQHTGADKPERCVKCQSSSISLISYARQVQLAAGGGYVKSRAGRPQGT